MNPMRERAKEHFPTVLLTLLSIVQALALELLWAHLHEADYLFQPSWIAVISWVQIAATLLGIVLIWVVYAANVMRFRWVPVTSDTVYPFVIGLLEFLLIDTLGADEIGLWLVIMASTFGVMQWVAHSTMRLARRDRDNAAFFADVDPAQLRDFYPQIAIVCALAFAGLFVLTTGDQGTVAMLALLATNGLLLWQFHNSAEFWKRSIADDA
ncbi:MAG: hypothetical protein E2O58_08185 [Gammaproteobacteria bacterium]|nr:MAG: hypothetical protein E2O58_08185 [Gammaproteobacteria bacterium]